jgi:hypothetical protein
VNHRATTLRRSALTQCSLLMAMFTPHASSLFPPKFTPHTNVQSSRQCSLMSMFAPLHANIHSSQCSLIMPIFTLHAIVHSSLQCSLLFVNVHSSLQCSLLFVNVHSSLQCSLLFVNVHSSSAESSLPHHDVHNR